MTAYIGVTEPATLSVFAMVIAPVVPDGAAFVSKAADVPPNGITQFAPGDVFAVAPPDQKQPVSIIVPTVDEPRSDFVRTTAMACRNHGTFVRERGAVM